MQKTRENYMKNYLSTNSTTYKKWTSFEKPTVYQN